MKDMRCAEHAARVEMVHGYRILVRKAECNRLLRRDKCDYGNNIKLDHKQTGWELVDWIRVAQHRDDWRCCGYSNYPSTCYNGPFSTDFISVKCKKFLHISVNLLLIQHLLPDPRQFTLFLIMTAKHVEGRPRWTSG